MFVFVLLTITLLQINNASSYNTGRGYVDDSYMQTDPHTWMEKKVVERYRTVPKGCGGKPADVYFILDTSNDVTDEELQTQKEFLVNLTPVFHMGQDTTRIGVLSYGNNVLTVARLGTYKEAKKLQESIKVTPRVGGRRDTAQILRYLRTKAFSPVISRENVAHVVILLTNGYSHTPKMTRLDATLLRKTGAYVYTVSLGDRVDTSEMVDISSSPATDFVFASHDFSIADSLMTLLRIHECDFQIDPPMTDSKPFACSPRRPADIVFPVDHIAMGSLNTEAILHVIQGFLDSVDPELVETAVLFSKTSFVTALHQNVLESVKSAQDRLKTVVFPDLGKLLKRSRRVLGRGRKGIQKTVVLFLDDSVPLTNSAFIEAKRNRFLKIETYVVYVGTKNRQQDLKLLSNGRGKNQVIQVSSYEELALIQEKILLNVCKGL